MSFERKITSIFRDRRILVGSYKVRFVPCSQGHWLAVAQYSTQNPLAGDLYTSMSLRIIKILHTIIWALFAACILTIPLAAWAMRFDYAFLLIVIVLVEVLVLALNAWRCPLSEVAARYTDDNRYNFDIYLPAWMARRNKTVFGTIFLVGVLFTIVRYLGWLL